MSTVTRFFPRDPYDLMLHLPNPREGHRWVYDTGLKGFAEISHNPRVTGVWLNAFGVDVVGLVDE